MIISSHKLLFALGLWTHLGIIWPILLLTATTNKCLKCTA